jgi:anti-sigma factor RsiW
LTHDQKQDQEIFMLSLGELSGFAKLSAQAHLIACAQCQSRMADFQTTSSTLRFSISPNPGGSPVHLTIKQLKLQFAAYAVALVVGASALVVGITAVRTQNSIAGHPTIIQCRPGIPSDKCH